MGRISTAVTVADGPLVLEAEVVGPELSVLKRARAALPNRLAESLAEANILLPIVCDEVPPTPRTAFPLRGPSGHPFNVMLVTATLLAETALIWDGSCVLFHAEATMALIFWPKDCWLS